MRMRKKAQKKRVGLILWLISLFLVIWLILSWYFGSLTESYFRQLLHDKSELIDEKFLRVELISHKSTLFGGSAKLRINSDIPEVDEVVGELLINAKFSSGPLFITKNRVKVGSSLWLLEIDEENLSESQQQAIHAIFSGDLPIVSVNTDFQYKAYYHAIVNSSLAKVTVTGVYTLETEEQEESNRGAINLSGFSYYSSTMKLSADEVQISYQHQKSLSANYKPGTTSFHIPELRIDQSSILSKPISLNVDARSNLSVADDSLNGFLRLELQQNTKQSGFPMESAYLSLSLNRLSKAGVLALTEAKETLDNLKQQIDWTIEDRGAYPEGRDEIIELYDKVESTTLELNEIAENEIFQDENGSIRLEAKSQKGEAVSSLNTLIKASETQGQAESNLPSIDGKLELDLDDEMFRFIKLVFKNHHILEKVEFNKQFKLEIKQGKLLYHSEIEK